MMFSWRSAIREALMLLGSLVVIGPVGFATFGAVGLLTWAILGEWFVRYNDQYDWLAGCLDAGGICGIVGVLASLAWWVRLRIRAATPTGVHHDDPAKPP